MNRSSFDLPSLHRRLATPLLAVICACVLLARPHSATATTIVVTTTTDEVNTDGDCSLREAIRAANTNAAVDACPAGSNVNTDTVTLANKAVYSLTIPGTDVAALQGGLDIENNTAAADLVIDVASDGSATISQDAFPDDSVVFVRNGAHLTVNDVTIRGGGTSSGASGGGINADSNSTVILERCVLEDNFSINNGGAIRANGSLQLDACVVRNNVAQNSGGGIITGSSTSAAIAIKDTLFQGNVAIDQSGGAIRANAGLAVLDSSFVDNQAAGLGGAIASGSPQPGSVAITNSCIIGNADDAVDSFNAATQLAQANWWGASDGPSGAGSGSGDSVGVAFAAADFENDPPAACRPQELVSRGNFGTEAELPPRWRARKLNLAGGDGVACSGLACSASLVGTGPRKLLLQTLDVSGNAGDAFTFRARSSATDVPVSPGRYLVELQIVHADGSTQRKVLKFSPGTHGFEEKSKTITASEPYSRLKVRIEYGRPSGTATFDDVSVLLE